MAVVEEYGVSFLLGRLQRFFLRWWAFVWLFWGKKEGSFERGQGGEFPGGALERENEGEGEKEDFWRATREEGDDAQWRKKKGDSGGRRLQTE